MSYYAPTLVKASRSYYSSNISQFSTTYSGLSSNSHSRYYQRKEEDIQNLTEVSTSASHKEHAHSISRLIYECYKPSTLSEAQEYINYMLQNRSILPNEIEELSFDPSEPEEQEPIHKPDKYCMEIPSGLSLKLTSYLKDEIERRKGMR